MMVQLMTQMMAGTMMGGQENVNNNFGGVHVTVDNNDSDMDSLDLAELSCVHSKNNTQQQAPRAPPGGQPVGPGLMVSPGFPLNP